MIIVRWIINALAIMLAAYVVPGVHVNGFWSAMLTALIMGLINALVRPIIILLTLPINIVTLGLFTFVINALMFWLASTIVKGFYVDGFGPAFWGALIFWLVSWATNSLLHSNKNTKQ